MTSKSSKMLTANLTVLIISGTSGLSKDLVALDTAVSMAELRHWKELRRMFVKLVLRVPAGTNPSANVEAEETKMILSSNPSIAWKKISVYASPSREWNVRADLSPMMTHAALGRPSLMTSDTTPIYV